MTDSSTADAPPAPYLYKVQWLAEIIILLGVVVFVAVGGLSMLRFPWFSTESIDAPLTKQVHEQAEEAGAQVFDLNREQELDRRGDDDVKVLTASGVLLSGRVLVQGSQVAVVIRTSPEEDEWVRISELNEVG